MAALYGEEFSRSRGSPSSFNSSSSSPRASDLEQTRPQTSGEEELQLQLALAMSRQESQKEQRSRHGDDSLLQKALDESKRGNEPETGESAMRDLVDIFGPVSGAPPSDDPWDTQPSCPVNSDPWESVAVVNSSTPVIGSPWMAPPTSDSPSQPWGCGQSSSDPWDPPTKTSPNPVNHAWRSPTNNGDPFSVEEEDEPKEEEEGLPNLFSPRAVSPADSDPFGDSVVVVEQVNGNGGESPETFDLSRLGPPLSATDTATSRQRPCRTPEAFLGPSAASLVNLDTLIPSNPPANSKNPFLSGLSAPSPTNPFHCDQPRLTLNQLRPSSTSPLPPRAHTSSTSSSSASCSMPYSASLPLPVPRHAAAPSLPSSFTQPPQGLLDLPSNLPQPLLPLSSAPLQQQQHNHHHHHLHQHHQHQHPHHQRFSPQPSHPLQPQSHSHSHNPFL